MAATPPYTLLVFGLGYAGSAVARLAVTQGWRVFATTSQPAQADGITRLPFEAADAALPQATHLLASAPPGANGDPVLARYRDGIERAGHLSWIGYFSTTGVYGDRGGRWVDETTPASPASSPRAARRLAAEADWCATMASASGGAVDLLRLAGIYGPGRSPFEGLRAGTARRILAPGHCFGRIHRDDIAGASLAAMRAPPAAARVLNLTDDLPEESAVVTAHAASLLGLPAPDGVPLAEAWESLSAMARSFWSDNRKVSGRLTQQALGYNWRYPTYREGLAAILAEEST